MILSQNATGPLENFDAERFNLMVMLGSLAQQYVRQLVHACQRFGMNSAQQAKMNVQGSPCQRFTGGPIPSG